MGVDFNRISFGISSGISRNGFGTIVSNPSGGGSPSYPPAGTILETLTGQTYPIAEGGSSVQWYTTYYPNQVASVYRKADGTGGNYLDWANAFAIAYAGNGVQMASLDGQDAQVEVPSGSGFYYVGGTYTLQAYHDGTGYYYEYNTNYNYYPNGTDGGIQNIGTSLQTEIPSGSGNYYNNGKLDGYTWNGTGGYNYPVTKGDFYANGEFITFYTDGTFSTSTEVPTGSGNYYDAKECGNDYFWNGIGGTNGAVPVCKFFGGGTFIYSDGTNNWYWNGSGGYYPT